MSANARVQVPSHGDARSELDRRSAAPPERAAEQDRRAAPATPVVRSRRSARRPASRVDSDRLLRRPWTMIGVGCCEHRRLISTSPLVNASSASARTATPLAPFGMPRLRIVGPRGPGDVEVRPRQPAGELLQEHRRRARARRTAAGVEHVGDLAVQLLGVFVEERHRPAAIAGALGRRPHDRRPTRRADRTAPTWPCRAPPRTAPVSVATSTRCVAPSFCAYQRPSPRISRPSASVLITSTVLPPTPRQHVARLDRAAAGHVFGRRARCRSR